MWTSPNEHHLVFVHAGDEERYDALHRRIDELAGDMPDRAGNAIVVRYLNLASRGFPPPVLFLVLGVVGLVVRRPENALALSTPAIAAVIVIVLSALAIEAIPYYSVPAAPAFLLLAAGWLVASRAGARSGLGRPALRPCRSWRTRALMPRSGRVTRQLAERSILLTTDFKRATSS